MVPTPKPPMRVTTTSVEVSETERAGWWKRLSNQHVYSVPDQGSARGFEAKAVVTCMHHSQHVGARAWRVQVRGGPGGWSEEGFFTTLKGAKAKAKVRMLEMELSREG